MKKNLKKVVLVLALLLPGVIKAQEFNVTAKADFVSDYIWREWLLQWRLWQLVLGL